jgi:serine/threonine protein kinase
MTSFRDCFEVMEKLGAGHYAEVFKCRNKATGELHAVKVVDKKKTTTKQQGDLLGEVSVLKELKHDNCMKLSGFYDEGDKVFVVLELISGGELFAKICAEKHFSEKEAAKIMGQLLSGLAYLHGKHIIHRDLKPENLLLTSKDANWTLKIVDFGFAEKVEGESLVKCCGTPLYIAPEVLNAGLFKTGPPYGVKADVWSAGVICYILLCGYPPFRAKTQADQFKKVVEAKLEFPPTKMWGQVSPAAIDFIQKMLIVDINKRASASDMLKHDWLRNNIDENLPGAVEQLKNFSAQGTWRRGVFGVEALNRILYLTRCTNLKIKPNTAIERLLLEANEPIRAIDLTTNYVGPNGLLALLDVVERNPVIEELVLGCNGATNQVVERLCVIARNHPSLRTIVLDDNPISHLAGRMLLYTLQCNTRITNLSLKGTVLQPQMLARIALQLHKNRSKSEKAA